MGSLRSELTDAQWARLEGLLPGRAGTVGRPAADNRRFVNRVLWVLRSGMRWGDLPERYGPHRSVHKRFVNWARAGVWDKVFADLVRDGKNPNLMIDSTIVRAHQQAAAGRKKRLRRPDSGAKPRRTEHQDPPAHRRFWLAAGFPSDRRLSRRTAPCLAAVARSSGPSRHRRQGL